ncbi:hypothetical protein FHG87_012090 [Trinorchestia longiramus]|nr:hypothetical protein FHG87_012090 [Trinorchestia longiramus]
MSSDELQKCVRDNLLETVAMRDNADRSGGEDGTLENSLPQPFVESMRTLFDILDDQHTGRVKFSDIERRWHEDEDCTTSGLPPGVLESLRVVTPQDGYLSFSRFCKGLQETSRPPDHQRASGSLISSREEAPPPIPPPPSHQAYQAPQLPYISHPNSGSLKNQDFNGNRKLSNPNYTSTGWLPQKTKPGSAAQPVGLYGGGSMYDVKKSIDGPIYQQHTLLSNNKYHLNGLSHHGDSSRENRNNNVPPSTQIQSFHVSGSNIRAAPLNSPLKNGSKSSNGSSSSSSNGENSSNSRSGFGVQVQKSDIRMGTGGMMSVYGSKVTSSSNTYSKSSHGVPSSQGPPKPPRSLESQNSDNNLNSVDKFNGKSNGSLNQQVRQSNSSHRVDSIINKMEALNTYATSSNTNNSNIHKEKIYDSIASKNRQGVAPVTNGFYVSSNTKSSNSSNQTHPYRKESGQSRQDDADYDHWSSERIKRGSSKPSGSSSSSNGSRAPAALPLSAVLNGYSLQRSQTHSHITTHSLERDSRADARRVSQDSNPGSRVR